VYNVLNGQDRSAYYACPAFLGVPSQILLLTQSFLDRFLFFSLIPLCLYIIEGIRWLPNDESLQARRLLLGEKRAVSQFLIETEERKKVR
jgi:hypothetical protein